MVAGAALTRSRQPERALNDTATPLDLRKRISPKPAPEWRVGSPHPIPGATLDASLLGGTDKTPGRQRLWITFTHPVRAKVTLAWRATQHERRIGWFVPFFGCGN